MPSTAEGPPLLRRPGPFRLATGSSLLSAPTLSRLRARFADPHAWIRHTDVFYRCDIAVLPDELEGPLRRRLRDAMAEALQLPLRPEVQLTLQRMGPGDGSDRHTDAPAAGFEAARLVVQLEAADGGVFRAFDDAGACWLSSPPRPGSAVALELSPRSHHDVTPCRSVRRTLVAHAWHPANPPDLGDRLRARFAGMSFADLPGVLDPVMLEAEARHDDAATGRAAAAAWWAATEGHPDDRVVSVYRAALTEREPPQRVAAEACWWVDLWRDGFDRARWERQRGAGPAAFAVRE